MDAHNPIQCIVPPHLLREVAARGSPRQQEWARGTLRSSEQFRGQRLAMAETANLATTVSATAKERVVYDAQNGTTLPGTTARSEGDPATNNAAVDEAYDGSGDTYDMYQQVYGRRSLDDDNMRLESTVHYGQGYDNAFWNGEQMVYGDGDEDLSEDERLFHRFTRSLDVIGHELTHGVVQFTAGLVYRDQPGALNEHFADVFGALVKQWKLNQTADVADWLIGAELLTDNVNGDALRSMKAPGTAYNDPVFGVDPQPAHMNDYKDVDYDNGGVHINSGIPNHAFYVTAREIGGAAWERAGRIWYLTLTNSGLTTRPSFQDAADLTYSIAATEYGKGSSEHQAVRTGWSAVGIQVNDTDTGDKPPEKDDKKDQEPGKKGCLVVLATLGMVH